MSSIIVLDSSDEEDEAPAKKFILSQSIPATITPIKSTTNVNAMKQSKALRSIPGGITITARRSPLTTAASNGNNAATQPPPPDMLTKLLLDCSPANIAKPQLPILPKISAAFKLNHIERRTPTPPKQQHQLLPMQQQQLPPLQPSPTMRKRKTPTPPTRKPNTPPASTVDTETPPPLLPLITSVQSMAESATPPLQLLATPPHTASINFSEQLLMNAHLMHTQLPDYAVINQLQYNNNNNDNSYKIQLPPKRGVGSNSITASYVPHSPALKASTPTPPPVVTAPTSNSSSLLKANNAVVTEKPSRRIKPTTLLKQTDEAWLQRTRPPPVIPLNVDIMEVPSTSASNSPQPTVAKKLTSKQQNATKVSAVAVIAPVAAASTVLDLTNSPAKQLADISITVVDDASKIIKQQNSSCSSPHTPTPELNGECSPPVASVAESENAVRPPLEPDFVQLIEACRQADATPDMERLIEAKLHKYYYGVHPDFVRSRGFRKHIRAVTERIRAEPELVYYNIKTIVDELKARRKCKAVVVNNEESAATSSGSTGNKHTDEQIKKLNKALYIITKRIESLEEAEVDWDDDVSTYVQVERYKKRACQIYEKICDLTGESKNALRLVKKPIQFAGTSFAQFNKTLQAYINRTKEFPDYFDVLRMLEHCNRQYELGLANFEMKRIAHDAFIKVGKLLQSRRKTDLYETVTHFTANTKDPATMDPSLLAKLSENQKHQTKISTIIEKYAREQDHTADEQKEARLKEKLKATGANVDGEQAQTSTATKVSNGTDLIKSEPTCEVDNVVVRHEGIDDEDDDDDEDELDEEDEADDINTLVEVVENLANGGELSDAESDVEIPTGQLFEKCVQKLEATSDKDKHSSSAAEDMATKTTENAAENRQTTKMTIAGDPKICDNMEAATLTGSCISSSASKNVNRTVNNNVMRTKTGEEAPVEAPSAALPNGRLNEATAASTIAAVVTAALPALKIISVTSLNESISLNSANTSRTTDSTATSTKMSAMTTTTCASSNVAGTAQKSSRQAANAKQRTVAEIVISDEES